MEIVKQITSIVLLTMLPMIMMGQGKIKYPYYSSVLRLQDGSQVSGVILQTTDSSIQLINRRDWKYIKGRQRNSAEIKKAFYERNITDYPSSEITYHNLAIAEIKKRKGQSALRWVGMGGGIILGALTGIAIGNQGQNGRTELPLTMFYAGLLGGLGYGAGSLFSIRFPKKILVKELEDKKWQERMVQYSILR